MQAGIIVMSFMVGLGWSLKLWKRDTYSSFKRERKESKALARILVLDNADAVSPCLCISETGVMLTDGCDLLRRIWYQDEGTLQGGNVLLKTVQRFVLHESFAVESGA